MSTLKFSQFCLTGHGYLEGKYRMNGQVYVRIRALQLPQPHQHTNDEVTLHCLVDSPKLLALIPEWEQQLSEGHTLILAFQVAYSQFSECYRGRAPDDPDHMLILHGKLREIGGWYRDGEWAKFSPQIVKKVAVLAAA